MDRLAFSLTPRADRGRYQSLATSWSKFARAYAPAASAILATVSRSTLRSLIRAFEKCRQAKKTRLLVRAAPYRPRMDFSPPLCGMEFSHWG